MKLNTIIDKASIKRPKRVGRGIGSGKGKTSGAGHKGQKSRSGVAIKGFEGGQMPLHRRLPKRGFKNRFRTEYSIINIGDIDKAISDKKIDTKKIITNEDFFNAGLIRNKNVLVKILGNGKTNHSLNLKVDKASQSAIKLISDKKGKIDYNEKVQKTEKKVSKEEEVKKN
ncbi:50S ribosomal protein L15 [Alphaproteobacteria bacterium]|nr:50S ribosomal protein L15 [Alphaproteobacteria bacterium]